MRWHELKELLKDYPVDPVFEHDSSVKLHSMMYLAPVFSEYSKEILYIGYYDDFARQDFPERTQISVLLCCKCPPDSTLLSSRTLNALCIYDEKSFQDCANYLQSFFARFLSMDDWLKQMYDKMHKGASLSEVTNLIAERYQRPVNIVDTSYSVIACSDNFAEYDQKLADDQARGFVPPEIIKDLNIRARRGNKLSYEPVLLNDPVDGVFVHYSTPILVDEVQIGTFSVFFHPDETLSYEQYLFLPQIARILSIFLQKKNFFLKSDANYYAGLLESLFVNSNLSVIDIESRLSAFGHEILPNKYIVAVNVSNIASSTISHIASTLQNILKHSIYTTIGNELVFLKSSDVRESTQSTQKLFELVANLPDSIPSLKIGISSNFTSLWEAKNALEQARVALEIGSVYEPTVKVYHYDDYRLECMVYRLSETTNISLYCYPQLYSLLEYDKQHQTQLLYTLFVYIFCSENKSIPYMCSKLNIHKNTLYFRLNKAKELTGLDYEKPSVAAMIIFTFALMRLNGQISWSQHEL